MALDHLPAAAARNGGKHPGGARPPHPPAGSVAAPARILDGPADHPACGHYLCAALAA